MKAIGPPRRAFKPKGILAVFLPVKNHFIPERLQQNLDSGHAISINWNDLEKDFYSKLDKAYQNRNMKFLIKNQQAPKINPQGIWGRIENWLGFRF